MLGRLDCEYLQDYFRLFAGDLFSGYLQLCPYFLKILYSFHSKSVDQYKKRNRRTDIPSYAVWLFVWGNRWEHSLQKQIQYKNEMQKVQESYFILLDKIVLFIIILVISHPTLILVAP